MSRFNPAKWLPLALLVGALFSGCPAGCTKAPCGPSNCDGCCDSSGVCRDSEQATCGLAGAACKACGDTEQCQEGACAPVMSEEDAGVPDAGPPPCRVDNDCAYLNQGMRCDEKTGACIPAKGCSQSADCAYQLDPSQPDYCDPFGVQCRCVEETNDAGFSGVCRRRLTTCEPCNSDVECGSINDYPFDPPGVCKTLPNDTTGQKFCFQAKVGACGCGMVDDGSGFCIPQSGTCDEVGCTADKDCPGGKVCNTQRCLCETRCRWDYARQTDDCPPGTVCWADNANLDPASPFFGAGRCRPPCSDDQECTNPATNPFGGSKLKCGPEKLPGGGDSLKRCRANGECMDDLECPEQPNDSLYLGYCDRGNFTCKTDCRVGVDPVSGQTYDDCREPYKCVTGTGANTCVLKSCMEQGGARIACNRGQFCCGEDKDGDGNADPCPPEAQLEPNRCYDAPKPPFCTTCTSNADCQNVSLPGWAGSCPNGSKSPSCSPLPNLCLYAGDRPEGGQGVNLCAPSTYNDTTKDSFGVGKDTRGCPAGYLAQGIRPKLTAGNDPNYCTTNADCSHGGVQGICDVDTTALPLQDGTYPKACLCSDPGLPSNCPNATDGGVTSVCRFAAPGTTNSVCLQSVVCLPVGGVPYKPVGAPEYGCGL